MNGLIEPPDVKRSAEYWLTRRSVDSAPGYDLMLPDIRVRYRWNGNGAWVSGYYEGIQRREPMLVCLHSSNGWRLECEAVDAS